MKNLILIIVSLFLVSPGMAETLHGEWGIGLGDSGQLEDGSKYLAIGLPSHLGRIWEQEPEAGMMFDKRSGDHSSQWLAYKIGLEPRYRMWYTHYMIGPAYVTASDARLGSNFQITHEVGVGFKDERRVRLGIDYRHFSNAGIIRPNQGKDFIGFQMEVPI